jgi:hypothetical protein
MELRHLRDGKAITDDEDTNAYGQLNSLEEIDDVAKPWPPDTESNVTIILYGKFV